ncbi:MAG: hypothetical protein R2883_04490 [Caldisericia bacterium]
MEQDDENSFWSAGFKDQRKGSKIFLGTDEETQIAFAVSSPQGTKDGETIKVKIEVLGCGESKQLSWSITNKLMECTFELEWAEKKSTTKTTVETDSRWNETFYIWNFSDYEGLFSLDIEIEGEPIVAYLDNYDIKIKSGTFEEVTITFQIHSKAKVGDSTVKVIATCGKNTQTLDRRFLIKRKSDCQFDCYFLESETDNLGIDMEVGKEVQIPVYVKNNSVDPQLFSVKVVRSETDWASGLVEGKVRQTFNLGSGGDTSNLVIWIRGEDDTKPGDTCKLTIVITACNTKKTLVCNVTCVEKSELDVDLEYEVTYRKWKKNGMLEVGNRIEFDRKGSGNIQTQNYKIKFFDAQQDNAYIGELEEVRLVMTIYKGRPQWDFKYYISTDILEKLQSFDSKKIKAKMTISMLYTHEETTDVITKELETTFELP